MRGVLIAGTGPGAGEAAVAAAAGDAVPLVAGPDAATAPPAIAARHAGHELSPPALVEEARALAADGALLVVATSGGLMAPLAERYLNRDLALELRLPVVVAAPAGPGLMNAALLAVDAARRAGLLVPAVVVTGWPEQPNRVLLDERALLAGYLTVPVLTLDGTHADLPVLDWADAVPTVPESPEEEPAAPIALDPYDAWEEQPTGDPRHTPRAQIMNVILEIVAAEGPMRASRAYSLYNRASGGRKLTTVARAPLSSAVYWLAQERRLILTRKDEIPWQDDDVIRLPDTAPVRVRELGPRTLEEVPLDEIAELTNRLRAARGIGDPTALKRAILNVYGLKRLTTRADEYLGLALDLAA
jgi:hypothetical protein